MLQDARRRPHHSDDFTHVVQFYENEEYLCAQVTDFLKAGLKAGDSLVVIANESRRDAFARGLGIGAAGQGDVAPGGRCALLDAQETLDQCMAGGMPDWERFQQVVGPTLGRATSRSRSGRVRAYGEMVDLLWRAGNLDAALRLEEMWNELAKFYSFDLFCAYVIGNFFKTSSRAELAACCGAHTHAMRAEAGGRHSAAIDGVDHDQLFAAELGERDRVERSLRDALRRMRQSEAATSELARALTTEEVSEVLLSFSERVLGAAAGVVYLRREQEGELFLQGSRGVPPAGQLPVLPSERALPLPHAVATREPIWIESYAELIERFPIVAGAATPRERLQAVVAMPLLHAGQLAGAFALSFDAPRTFSEADRAWLTSLAAQCAIAAERARLFESEKRARAEAETLFRITESLGEAQLDLEALVQRVTDQATQLVSAQFGAFFYNAVNEQGEAYVLYALSGAPKEAFAKLGLPRNTPIFAPTFAGEGVVRLADVRKDPRFGTMSPHYGMPKGHLPVVSYLAVPVVSRTGAVLGGLFFGHAEADRFTEQHERMVKALATHAAAAIDGALMFRATRQAESAQRRLVTELKETVRLNELFAGVLAHDLRNPLGATLNAAQLSKELVARGELDKLERPLSRIVNSGERMSRMIDQLLDFTRIRVGSGIRMEPKRVDLCDLARRVFEELEGAQAGTSFQLESAGDATGVWDEDRLCQVLSNLCANAIQHGTREGPVHVRVDGADPATVRLSVRNGGVIPAELMPTLFAPLGGKVRSQEKSSGLGLGLFITHEIVEAHGGEVHVVSNEADGTTFSLSLPRLAQAATAASSGTAPQPPPVVEEAASDGPWSRTAELGESSRRFRLLVDSVKDYAIFMLDRHGRVASWNAGAERIKGYAAREIIGHHFSRFYEESDVKSGLCERELEIASGEGRFEGEGFRVRKDGTRFWANVVITALRDPNGALLGFAKVTRDLTERRRLEEERLRRAQAEEALRLRDEFLSIASHELKTPLTVLQLQLDALEQHAPSLDKGLLKTLERARRGGARLGRLVESLLEVTRIATDTFTLWPERFDLGEVVDEVLEDVRSAAQHSGCDIDATVERPLIGFWDRRRIQQLLARLVWNALTFAERTPVRISASRQGDDLLLEVADGGPGISAADLERIFERFERAGAARDHAGFGLGLYIVREIAKAHGGSVTVESAPGQGARFIVRLPLECPVKPDGEGSGEGSGQGAP